VKSAADKRFWKFLAQLPPDIQSIAHARYALWKDNPQHPSLRFKELRPGLWSVRINLSYRALGIWKRDTIVWFWIGPHDEYEQKIK
jgi:hypothetical protein